ncbi:MAG TPA: arginine--tRNA ligase [Acidobacteriota bacterium]|nr:arginine--tRNA ligase [Acidobacteriota bacterium]
MITALAQAVEKRLLQRIAERYQVRYDHLNFTYPPKIELGELALPVAFELARKVKRPPREIAQELAADAQQIAGLWKADVAGGGYLNFHLDRAAFALRLAESIAQREFGRAAESEVLGKIIVEHTNINPNKAAHIGHLRNAALGDSFVRCLRFLGHQVEVQNYLDNTGVQVADVVVGLERMEGKTLQQVAAIPGKFDYYCWDVYAKVADFYAQAEENKKWRSHTLQAIEAGSNPTAEMAQFVSTKIVQAHLATMARINVEYDLLPRESEILHLQFWEKAFSLLKQREAVYFVEAGKNRGCWVMKTESSPEAGSEAFREGGEDEEKIIVRSDGTVTYVGKDVAYQLWKFGLLGLDFNYEPFTAVNGRKIWITTTVAKPGVEPPNFGRGRRVYNVIDSRQAYLQNIVLLGLKALGYEEEARNSIHFSYEMVALSPACYEEMGFRISDEDKRRPYFEVSGRKGLGVKADDLLDMLMRKALEEVQSRHSLSDEEACRIARTIAVGALRYFLLRFARNTVIAFDFKEALSFDGETGPYVQYAVVRADNIFRKLEEAGGKPPTANEIDPAGLGEFLSTHDDIWELVYQAGRLPEVIRQVTQSMELSQLCKFVFYLAQKFNLFYHRYHILSEPDLRRQRQLLLIVDIVRSQMEKALDLLGCEVPAKM